MKKSPGFTGAQAVACACVLLTSACATRSHRPGAADGFCRADNGVTIKCPGTAPGEQGVVDGVTYTRRAKAAITPANAATTCTSGITDMSYVFADADEFNAPIGHWDVASVTNMKHMFHGADDFNEGIGRWDVGRVENLQGMFKHATRFNQDIGDWDVSSVTNMGRMFRFTEAFNHDLSRWCVRNIAEKPAYFSLYNPLTPVRQPVRGSSPGSPGATGQPLPSHP